MRAPGPQCITGVYISIVRGGMQGEMLGITINYFGCAHFKHEKGFVYPFYHAEKEYKLAFRLQRLKCAQFKLQSGFVYPFYLAEKEYKLPFRFQRRKCAQFKLPAKFVYPFRLVLGRRFSFSCHIVHIFFVIWCYVNQDNLLRVDKFHFLLQMCTLLVFHFIL